MTRFIRLVLMLGGLALLAVFLARVDGPAVWNVISRTGALAPLGLLPYLFVYLVDTAAWATLLTVPRRPGFARLFQIRWAGEALNNLIPTGYVGGEAVKVYLLLRLGVPATESAVAAVTSKTAQTVAQVVFVVLGAMLFARLAPTEPGLRRAMFGVAAAGGLGIAVFLALQRRGLSAILLGLLDFSRVQVGWVARNRDRLLLVDLQTRHFYQHHAGRFYLGTVLFLAGWLLDAVEILLVGRLMGVAMDAGQAVAIEAFIGVAKIVGLLVPGAIGVQESGIVFLCRMAGLPEPFGYAYALWRRARELLYAAAGWGLLIRQHATLREIRKAAHSRTAEFGQDAQD